MIIARAERTVRPISRWIAPRVISGRGQALVLDDGRVVGRLTTRDPGPLVPAGRSSARQCRTKWPGSRPDPTFGVSATGGSIRSVGPPSCQTPISRPSWSTACTAGASPARRGPASPGPAGALRPAGGVWPTPSASRSWSGRVARGRPRATRRSPASPSSLSSLNVLTFHGLARSISASGSPPSGTRAARGAVGGRSVRAGRTP